MSEFGRDLAGYLMTVGRKEAAEKFGVVSNAFWSEVVESFAGLRAEDLRFDPGGVKDLLGLVELKPNGDLVVMKYLDQVRHVVYARMEEVLGEWYRGVRSGEVEVSNEVIEAMMGLDEYLRLCDATGGRASYTGQYRGGGLEKLTIGGVGTAVGFVPALGEVVLGGVVERGEFESEDEIVGQAVEICGRSGDLVGGLAGLFVSVFLDFKEHVDSPDVTFRERLMQELMKEWRDLVALIETGQSFEDEVQIDWGLQKRKVEERLTEIDLLLGFDSKHFELYLPKRGQVRLGLAGEAKATLAGFVRSYAGQLYDPKTGEGRIAKTGCWVGHGAEAEDGVDGVREWWNLYCEHVFPHMFGEILRLREEWG